MTFHDAQLVVYSFLVGLGLWPAWRLFHPWRCACGHIGWRTHAFVHHVEAKHVHLHGGGK